jgi:putative methyltransferase (TIGR04325 family)
MKYMALLATLKHKLFVGSRTSGVYCSVAEALRHVRPGRKVGYDHEEAADLYPWLMDYTKISDFAILFYFNKLLRPGMRIFDFGGNIGVLYYAFQKRWRLPENVTWTVCDVPAVVRAGIARAAERTTPGLEFTSDFREAANADVLLTSGTLQCVEEDFAPMLEGLGAARPRHLLINRVPMWDRPELVSLQDLGPVVYPYRVFERSRFLSSLATAGYGVQDQWECPEKSISIRFRPWIRIQGFDGYYLTLNTAS